GGRGSRDPTPSRSRRRAADSRRAAARSRPAAPTGKGTGASHTPGRRRSSCRPGRAWERATAPGRARRRTESHFAYDLREDSWSCGRGEATGARAPSQAGSGCARAAHMTYEDVVAQMTGPGGPFEIETVPVRGRPMKNWKYRERSMREKVERAAGFGDTTFM